MTINLETRGEEELLQEDDTANSSLSHFTPGNAHIILSPIQWNNLSERNVIYSGDQEGKSAKHRKP